MSISVFTECKMLKNRHRVGLNPVFEGKMRKIAFKLAMEKNGSKIKMNFMSQKSNKIMCVII